jgi:hypothetical protein
MVLNDEEIESERRYQFTWNQKSKDIETRYISRTVQSTIDSKRIVLDDNNTVPFGYEFH